MSTPVSPEAEPISQQIPVSALLDQIETFIDWKDEVVPYATMKDALALYGNTLRESRREERMMAALDEAASQLGLGLSDRERFADTVKKAIA